MKKSYNETNKKCPRDDDGGGSGPRFTFCRFLRCFRTGVNPDPDDDGTDNNNDKMNVKTTTRNVVVGGGFSLPEDIWDHLVGFLDVPELGACAQVSKNLHVLTAKDDVWEAHLKKLLSKVYTGPGRSSFCIKTNKWWYRMNRIPVPLHNRLPLKSTDFRAWYLKWISGEDIYLPAHADIQLYYYYVFPGASIRGKYQLPDGTSNVGIEELTGNEGEFCRWLFEDVPLRTYYKEAGNFAYLGYERCRRCRDDDNFEQTDDHVALSTVLDSDLFRGLPNLKLFHGLGGYSPRRRVHYEYY